MVFFKKVSTRMEDVILKSPRPETKKWKFMQIQIFHFFKILLDQMDLVRLRQEFRINPSF